MYTTAKQLLNTINNTNEKVLSEKLTDYSLEHLKDFRDLVYIMSKYSNIDYQFDILINNDQDFWNKHFSNPYEVIKAISESYNPNDKYIYRKTDWLYYSCNNISDFYNNQDVKDLTANLSEQLKNNTSEKADQNMDFLTIEKVQKIIKKALK
ncbi:MAG: hypothetical protein [Caudoviricetes sp.]|nr:MAG: hypothetical protein [Caudoviricetes sp.]